MFSFAFPRFFVFYRFSSVLPRQSDFARGGRHASAASLAPSPGLFELGEELERDVAGPAALNLILGVTAILETSGGHATCSPPK